VSDSETLAVEYHAEIRQVKSMADHTTNVTLNFPEYCKKQSAWFLEHTGEMIAGDAALQKVLESLTNGESEIDERTTIPTADMVSR